MIQVNIHEAKTNLSKLIQRVKNGEEVIIAKAGEPQVQLVLVEKKGRIRYGALKGKISMAEDFNEMPEDILDVMEGKDRDIN